ncbi:hypothetical protein [Ferribacterium limneticum]|uniref:hypothetical protein n=1 Tax=Ferribacterium limneticum TaxID=76259 RepID=UPI001CF991C6|nr:hypothetical protein [Ferribacterium limneticum]UCV29107.1 hypothetical protein KI617_03135 [Ferribacterium limneticum]UCV33025.1 hypothetical protein KI608_03135 [Ferribacterium limneticum]
MENRLASVTLDATGNLTCYQSLGNQEEGQQQIISKRWHTAETHTGFNGNTIIYTYDPIRTRNATGRRRQ